jgi:predicted GNAT family N-acyltransferase
LRRRVFCGEQGVRPEADQDGRDGEAVHLVAVAGERVVGTCRLLAAVDHVMLGRMVVDPQMRRHGVGSRLLAAADVAALEMSHDRIVLHAQLPARGVYARAGYAERGEPFVEEGIDHVTMVKSVA